MNIVIKPELTRPYTSNERGNRQVIYFVLTDDSGVSYDCIDDLPSDADPQTYLDAHIEDELLFVRQSEYPEHPNFSATATHSALQLFEDWIAAGHQVETGKDVDGNPVMKIVNKIPWMRKH